MRTFFIQIYSVPSGSMENTLKPGDVLVVSMLTPRLDTLARGDIVVFQDPGGWLNSAGERKGPVLSRVGNMMAFVGLIPRSSSERLVKRVIGLAGDSVECDDQGILAVNGVPVDEPYIYPGDEPCFYPFLVTVPAHSVWVMGDHRSNSSDSRFHRDVNDGAVPMENVVGRVVIISSGGHLRRP